MKIYAIRDRLLDYYMQPFAGPDDKPVLASIAKMINAQGEQSDIAQAPHHFEVWELGTIDEEGHINPTRKLLADCNSLVRPSLRAPDHPRGPEDDPTAEISRGKTPDTYQRARTAQRLATAATQATDGATQGPGPAATRPAS